MNDLEVVVGGENTTKRLKLTVPVDVVCSSGTAVHAPDPLAQLEFPSYCRSALHLDGLFVGASVPL